MIEKLKPCPFCGCEASFSRYGMNGLFLAECEPCGIRMDGGESKIYAMQRWNTRANCQESLEGSSGHKTSPDEGYSYFVSFDYSNKKERGLGDFVIRNCGEKNINAVLIERIKRILKEKGFGNIVILNVIKLEV